MGNGTTFREGTRMLSARKLHGGKVEAQRERPVHASTRTLSGVQHHLQVFAAALFRWSTAMDNEAFSNVQSEQDSEAYLFESRTFRETIWAT